jgi:hypothetical protein
MSTQEAVRALVFRPGQPPEEMQVESFKQIQQIVGGYIERCVLEWTSAEGGIHLWCDEDGFAKDLPPNLWAQGPSYTGAPIMGTCVLTHEYADEEGESHYRSLTDEEVEKWSHLKRFEETRHEL